MTKTMSVVALAKQWAVKKRLFGTQAFLRYVILTFTECLNQVSDEFVFKGGNLLWVYIATPRATIDLDLATLQTTSHSKVRKLLERACSHSQELTFSILEFEEIEKQAHSAAAVVLGYSTQEGASNRFEIDIDIVYSLKTDHHQIPSPVHPEIMIRSATLENIVADKLRACHRFKSGNTRMKDFDDLWRLSQAVGTIDKKKLAVLINAESSRFILDRSWINPDLERIWATHRKRYKDLPESLENLFAVVNAWLLEK